MTDKLELQNLPDERFKAELDNVHWPIYYGSVKVQLRDGKPTLIVIERTNKLD